MYCRSQKVEIGADSHDNGSLISGLAVRNGVYVLEPDSISLSSHHDDDLLPPHVSAARPRPRPDNRLASPPRTTFIQTPAQERARPYHRSVIWNRPHIGSPIRRTRRKNRLCGGSARRQDRGSRRGVQRVQAG